MSELLYCKIDHLVGPFDTAGVCLNSKRLSPNCRNVCFDPLQGPRPVNTTAAPACVNPAPLPHRAHGSRW